MSALWWVVFPGALEFGGFGSFCGPEMSIFKCMFGSFSLCDNIAFARDM